MAARVRTKHMLRQFAPNYAVKFANRLHRRAVRCWTPGCACKGNLPPMCCSISAWIWERVWGGSRAAEAGKSMHMILYSTNNSIAAQFDPCSPRYVRFGVTSGSPRENAAPGRPTYMFRVCYRVANPRSHPSGQFYPLTASRIAQPRLVARRVRVCSASFPRVVAVTRREAWRNWRMA
eukprot:146411-Chlamydomonas_euryale.AAC.1